MTLEQLSKGLMQTFQQPNAWRFLVPPMAQEILRRCAGLAEAIRKDNQGAIRHATADIMAWILTTSGGLKINLNNILATNFPGCCPYCGNKPCCCKPEKGLPGSHIYNKRHSLAGWQRLLNQIYGKANQEREPSFLASKLVEEAGEMVSATCPLGNNPDDFLSELADLISRLIAIANYYSFSLEKAVLDTYPNFHCGRCGHRPCTCTSEEIARNYRLA